MNSLRDYRTWIFDCDGVLLNSNRIKTDAFFDVARSYGEDAADRLVAYHVQNGGISRFEKFRYFLTEILDRPLDQSELDRLLEGYAGKVREKLLDCDIAEQFHDVMAAVSACSDRRFIVSGGLQDELRDVFAVRKLDRYFTAIFGSPDPKDGIVARELASGNLAKPAVFIGDSRYDYQVAAQFSIDFIFVHQWTEFQDWPDFFADKPVTVKRNISQLLSEISR